MVTYTTDRRVLPTQRGPLHELDLISIAAAGYFNGHFHSHFNRHFSPLGKYLNVVN
jgi:hypothetical protein